METGKTMVSEIFTLKKQNETIVIELVMDQ